MDQPIQSALTYLECTNCGDQFDAEGVYSLCPNCNSSLLARYDLGGLRGSLTYADVIARPRGLWRWAELLPVRDLMVSVLPQVI